MACEVVSVCCLRVYRVCTHPVLSVSSQAGYPVYQADALAAEDADGIDFPGGYKFVRCVCLRECTYGFRVLEFANVLYRMYI